MKSYRLRVLHGMSASRGQRNLFLEDSERVSEPSTGSLEKNETQRLGRFVELQQEADALGHLGRRRLAVAQLGLQLRLQVDHDGVAIALDPSERRHVLILKDGPDTAE